VTACVLLLRGINVGGRNILPMAQLRRLLADLQLEDVATYIQSGNAVFSCPQDRAGKLALQIGTRIEEEFGFAVPAQVWPLEEFAAIAEGCPFAGDADPGRVLVHFLAEPATGADLDRLTGLQSASEAFQLTERAFYLHAPDGIGRSKLAAAAEKCLGVPATGRNLRTVDKLLAMARAIQVQD
jgi:uncharacterized protein (DUF1697 family)